MYDLVIIVFYIMFWLIGIWRKSLIMVVFNIINTFAFFVETGNLTISILLMTGLIAQTLITLGGD